MAKVKYYLAGESVVGEERDAGWFEVSPEVVENARKKLRRNRPLLQGPDKTTYDVKGAWVSDYSAVEVVKNCGRHIIEIGGTGSRVRRAAQALELPFES